MAEKFNSYEKYRAPLIARTETTAASNYADLDAVREAGLESRLKKAWLSSRDGIERETHAAADAQYYNGIALSDSFQVGSDSMESPGAGSVAGENINCRCTLLYIDAEQ